MRILMLSLAVAVSLSAAAPAAASFGVPDTTWAHDGSLAVDPSQVVPNFQIFPNADGSADVVATSRDTYSTVAFMRVSADGVLDAGYGYKDAAAADAGNFTREVARQSNRKFVGLQTYGTVARVVRWNTDGTLDATFGDDGVRPLPVTPGGYPSALRVSVGADDSIVVAARGQESHLAPATSNIFRLTPDGDLDATFGNAGVYLDSTISPYAMAVQPDGAVVMSAAHADGPAMFRLTAAGVPDPSFGNTQVDGLTVIPYGAGGGEVAGDAWLNGTSSSDLAIAGDGDIVASAGDGPVPWGVMRVDSAGTPDPGFGGNGWQNVTLPYQHRFQAIAVQPNGKVLLAGMANPSGSEVFTAATLIRLDDDGSRDSGFGSAGVINLTGSVDMNSYGEVSDIAVVAGGQKVLAMHNAGQATNYRVSLDRLWLVEPTASEPQVPENTSRPTLGGSFPSVTAGQPVARSTDGVWTNSPTSYVRTWKRCTSGGSEPSGCSTIAADGDAIYTTTADDVGDHIALQIVAVNAAGSSLPVLSAAKEVVSPESITAGFTVPKADGAVLKSRLPVLSGPVSPTVTSVVVFIKQTAGGRNAGITSAKGAVVSNGTWTMDPSSLFRDYWHGFETASYEAEIVFRDGKGAESRATRTFVIDPDDTDPPSLHLEGPAWSGTAFDGQAIFSGVMGDASDDSDLSIVLTTAGGAPVDRATIPYRWDRSEWAWATPKLAAGDYRIVVTQEDVDNREQRTATFTVPARPAPAPAGTIGNECFPGGVGQRITSLTDLVFLSQANLSNSHAGLHVEFVYGNVRGWKVVPRLPAGLAGFLPAEQRSQWYGLQFKDSDLEPAQNGQIRAMTYQVIGVSTRPVVSDNRVDIPLRGPLCRFEHFNPNPKIKPPTSAGATGEISLPPGATYRGTVTVDACFPYGFGVPVLRIDPNHRGLGADCARAGQYDAGAPGLCRPKANPTPALPDRDKWCATGFREGGAAARVRSSALKPPKRPGTTLVIGRKKGRGKKSGRTRVTIPWRSSSVLKTLRRQHFTHGLLTLKVTPKGGGKPFTVMQVVKLPKS